MKRSDRLVLLQELTKIAQAVADGYGGKGTFELPPTHTGGMVSEVGFSCAVCKWVDADNHGCKNKYYIQWNGGDPKLPDAPLDKICSDWFEPKE